MRARVLALGRGLLLGTALAYGSLVGGLWLGEAVRGWWWS